MNVLETSKPTRTRLRSLAAIGIVVASTFVRVFPFSSQLIASVLVLMITWFQDRSWLSAWFRSVPARRVLIGSLLGLAAIVTTDLMLLRVLPMLGLPNVDFSRFHPLRGDKITTAAWVAGVWLWVAPSEELISRGFLINQWLVVIGDSQRAPVTALMASSLTFGLIHFYQGASGVITNLCAGLWFGALYLHQRRSLWSNILVHGMVDTAAMLVFFLGWL